MAAPSGSTAVAAGPAAAPAPVALSPFVDAAAAAVVVGARVRAVARNGLVDLDRPAATAHVSTLPARVVARTLPKPPVSDARKHTARLRGIVNLGSTLRGMQDDELLLLFADCNRAAKSIRREAMMMAARRDAAARYARTMNERYRAAVPEDSITIRDPAKTAAVATKVAAARNGGLGAQAPGSVAATVRRGGLSLAA